MDGRDILSPNPFHENSPLLRIQTPQSQLHGLFPVSSMSIGLITRKNMGHSKNSIQSFDTSKYESASKNILHFLFFGVLAFACGCDNIAVETN